MKQVKINYHDWTLTNRRIRDFREHEVNQTANLVQRTKKKKLKEENKVWNEYKKQIMKRSKTNLFSYQKSMRINTTRKWRKT